MDKLRPNGIFNDIISIGTINKWEERIKRMKKTYDVMTIRRNKQIAHRDRNFDGSKVEHIKVKELQDIVVLVQEIMKEIYKATVRSSYLIEEPINAPIEGLKKVMCILNEDKRSKLRPIFGLPKANGLEDELPPSERN